MNRKAKLLPVRIYGDDILRKKLPEIVEIDQKVKDFAQDLTHTMYERDGVGLAANQVGSSYRMFVVDAGWGDENAPREPEVMINPVILAEDGEHEQEEGCISLPGIYASVRRPEWIKIRYLDLEGKVRELEADGLLAVAIQHENDHLDGILFIDHINTLAKLKFKRKLKELEKSAIDGVNIRAE